MIFGPPGSGKGTQATLLGKRRHLVHVSTGDVLRTEVAEGTPLGHEVAALMESGDLVSDDLMIRMVERRLHQPDAQEHSVLFDGFPRTLPQAMAFDAMLQRRERIMELIIFLDVPLETLRRRVQSRFEQEGRQDDNLETLERRMTEYVAKTVPAIEHYRAHPAFRAVDGDRDQHAVADDVDRLFRQQAEVRA